MPKLTDLQPVPDGINRDLDNAGNKLMLTLLGNPRSSYSTDCQPITNPKLGPRIETLDVGPFKVTGLDVAVTSLTKVLAEIKAEQKDVYDVLRTAGMLCCRFVRGSNSSISNHSWGTAIDLTIDGVLDQRGDNKVEHGLTLIAPIFNRHQWFWGAGFPTEDGMHFEASKQLVTSWFGSGGATVVEQLTVGDHGRKVAELQHKLNKTGEQLVEDGVFGSSTHAAVVAFQAAHGLVADGVVRADMWAKLDAL